jgi:hypothetical protein
VLRIIQRIRRTHQAAVEIEQRLRKGGLSEKERVLQKNKFAAHHDRVVELIQEIT